MNITCGQPPCMNRMLDTPAELFLKECGVITPTCWDCFKWAKAVDEGSGSRTVLEEIPLENGEEEWVVQEIHRS